MKKIGILTITRTDNNGTDLQALAMLNLFRKNGAQQIELINYKCNRIESRLKLLSLSSLKDIIRFPVRLYMSISHESFRRRYFIRSKNCYCSNTIKNIDYDIIITGSDQIWNVHNTGGDLSFYLPFKTKAKKFAYAASLGRTNLKEWSYKYNIEKYLQDFECVSVREESGVDALNQIGIKARYDLDPILMGDKKDWAHLLTNNAEEKYILVYRVGTNKMMFQYARKIANIKGLKIIFCDPSWHNVKDMESHRFVGVEKWLNLVNNANIIITDSYHCISFALLFKKDIRVFLLENSIESNSRMTNLMMRVGLSNNIITCLDCDEPQIDWDEVGDRINTLKDNSEKYVRRILES